MSKVFVARTGCSKQLAELVEKAPELRARDGVPLLVAGSEPAEVLVIVSGEVRVTLPGHNHLGPVPPQFELDRLREGQWLFVLPCTLRERSNFTVSVSAFPGLVARRFSADVFRNTVLPLIDESYLCYLHDVESTWFAYASDLAGMSAGIRIQNMRDTGEQAQYFVPPGLEAQVCPDIGKLPRAKAPPKREQEPFEVTLRRSRLAAIAWAKARPDERAWADRGKTYTITEDKKVWHPCVAAANKKAWRQRFAYRQLLEKRVWVPKADSGSRDRLRQLATRGKLKHGHTFLLIMEDEEEEQAAKDAESERLSVQGDQCMMVQSLGSPHSSRHASKAGSRFSLESQREDEEQDEEQDEDEADSQMQQERETADQLRRAKLFARSAAQRRGVERISDVICGLQRSSPERGKRDLRGSVIQVGALQSWRRRLGLRSGREVRASPDTASPSESHAAAEESPGELLQEGTGAQESQDSAESADEEAEKRAEENVKDAMQLSSSEKPGLERSGSQRPGRSSSPVVTLPLSRSCSLVSRSPSSKNSTASQAELLRIRGARSMGPGSMQDMLRSPLRSPLRTPATSEDDFVLDAAVHSPEADLIKGSLEEEPQKFRALSRPLRDALKNSHRLMALKVLNDLTPLTNPEVFGFEEERGRSPTPQEDEPRQSQSLIGSATFLRRHTARSLQSRPSLHSDTSLGEGDQSPRTSNSVQMLPLEALANFYQKTVDARSQENGSDSEGSRSLARSSSKLSTASGFRGSLVPSPLQRSCSLRRSDSHRRDKILDSSLKLEPAIMQVQRKRRRSLTSDSDVLRSSRSSAASFDLKSPASSEKDTPTKSRSSLGALVNLKLRKAQTMTPTPLAQVEERLDSEVRVDTWKDHLPTWEEEARRLRQIYAAKEAAAIADQDDEDEGSSFDGDSPDEARPEPDRTLSVLSARTLSKLQEELCNVDTPLRVDSWRQHVPATPSEADRAEETEEAEEAQEATSPTPPAASPRSVCRQKALRFSLTEEPQDPTIQEPQDPTIQAQDAEEETEPVKHSPSLKECLQAQLDSPDHQSKRVPTSAEQPVEDDLKGVTVLTSTAVDFGLGSDCSSARQSPVVTVDAETLASHHFKQQFPVRPPSRPSNVPKAPRHTARPGTATLKQAPAAKQAPAVPQAGLMSPQKPTRPNGRAQSASMVRWQRGVHTQLVARAKAAPKARVLRR
eukprot:TRINITY_DN4372_c0_g1_i2.p1 TRINITY_DN4372_c0_g1~~TRINITY_DN4372_c0_g1_i2.p1  ORF type:complete len:1196 (+),score=226.46 TRINITY_DN4372_c0_g1_i2:165-3752(+)